MPGVPRPIHSRFPFTLCPALVCSALYALHCSALRCTTSHPPIQPVCIATVNTATAPLCIAPAAPAYIAFDSASIITACAPHFRHRRIAIPVAPSLRRLVEDLVFSLYPTVQPSASAAPPRGCHIRCVCILSLYSNSRSRASIFLPPQCQCNHVAVTVDDTRATIPACYVHPSSHFRVCQLYCAQPHTQFMLHCPIVHPAR